METQSIEIQRYVGMLPIGFILEKSGQQLYFSSKVEIKAVKSGTFARLRNIGRITGVNKMPKSVSYHEHLIEFLKKTEAAAAYI